LRERLKRLMRSVDVRRHIPHLAIASLAAAGILLAASAEAQFRFPLPYPAGYGYVPESDLRIEVTPKDASVYVDGYFAGLVDEFDGTFQRLHVTPGQHEITIYLQGYRTIREKLYLSPRGSRKIERTMERLAPGESSEPVPEPVEPPMPPAGPPPAMP
jgi:hypothetical protein